MIAYIKKKLAKRRARTQFHTYGTTLKEFNVAKYGHVEYLQWLHPLEQPKEVRAENISFYKSLCRPRAVAIDIGAHTGDTTVPMAVAVGKSGLVIALEPNPHVFKILEANAKLNPEKTSIHPYCFAATESNGQFQFNYSDASYCNGGFLSQIKSQKHGHSHILTVEGKNLQSFLAEKYYDRLNMLDLIKVDAEGYDKEILKTIPGILAEHKPNLLIECYKRLTAEERHELFDIVDRYGYDLFKLDNFDAAGAETKLDREGMNKEKHFEMLAIHRERMSEFRPGNDRKRG